MTLEEFNGQGWAGGMKAEFLGQVFDVINCDFEDKTVGLEIQGEFVNVSHKLCTIMKDEPFHISTKDFQHHIMSLGASGSNKSIIEEKMTKAAKASGMILVVKAFDLPAGAMSQEVDLKGRVLIASVIGDNKEEIERQLISLNLIDEFDKSKSDIIVELATDILSHHDDLETK